MLAPLEQLVAQRVSAAVTSAADPSHLCSAITYSVERSLNWLGPGMACSHAPASGCATPMSREHSRSATFVPRTSPSSPAALTISSSHEPSWVTCAKLRWARRLVLHSGSAIWVRLGRAAAGGRPLIGW